MIQLLRSALVIARRDFTATVLSKTFIFFLLGPLFPLLFGGVFGSIGARVANRTDHQVVAVRFWDPDYARLSDARQRLADALPGSDVVTFIHAVPLDDHAGEIQQLLQSKDPPVRAVLEGNLDYPHLIGDADPATVAQLKMMIANARSSQRPAPVNITVTRISAANTASTLARDQALTAQIGQMLLFFLTILLSGMVLSQLIEEKSNKIIEVIAAAVPIDALFVGKLFAMLAASIVGIVVWLSAGALLIQLVRHGGIQSLPPPAVGWPTFLALGVAYFAMNYLLLGAVFLMIGAQASTAREVQTLSMPVTFMQVLVFGFAATTVGAPDTTEAIAASIFPLSSPMAMLARGAEVPTLWPHLLALAWQALWVALILRFGAMLFRRTVLKSGPRLPWWRFGRA